MAVKFSLFILMGSCLLGLACFAESYNPAANPESVITLNDIRITVLTDRVIRMEWADDQKFEDAPTLVFVNRNLPAPQFTKSQTGDILTVKTDYLELKYKTDSGKFSSDNLSIKYHDDDMSFTWQPGAENKGNLLGTARTLDHCDGNMHTRSNKPIQLEPGMISTNGWVLIDDTSGPVFDNSDWPWVTERTKKEHQDFYLFGYGKNYKQVLADYTRIAGRMPIPPKFAFGVWWSKWWAYTDEQFKDLVEEYEIHDVPLDVLVIDMDWHQPGWTGYTFSDEYFPDPAGFLKWTNEKNIKTCMNLHPAKGIQSHEKIYPEFAAAMGIDPETKKTVKFDIVDKKYATQYFDLVLHPMEKMGIDFWWNDWQQGATTAVDGVNPTFYLNYVHFTDMHRQGKRPLIFHRYGGLGNHRYQIGFSGDTQGSWKSLAYQTYFTANAANVCFGYWSHDIGGFFGSVDDPENVAERYTRWIQFGAFSPIFRTHGAKSLALDRRMWSYPLNYFYEMRNAIKLRYSLMPYIYSSAKIAHDTGVSLVSPLYYNWPDEDKAYNSPGQYMFGPDILAAPVTEPLGMDEDGNERLFVTKKIWLPAGEWFEWGSGTLIDGGKMIDRSYTLADIPLFVKSGAIIPQQQDADKIGARHADPLILNIFPGEKGRTQLYDDEGDNDNYLLGKYQLTHVDSQRNGNHLTVTVHSGEGEFEGMPTERSYEFRVILTYPPEWATVNGTHADVSYDGDHFTAIIKTKPYRLEEKVVLTVSFPEEDVATLSGKSGLIKRLKLINEKSHMYAALYEKTVKLEYSIRNYAKLAQTGNRITINPSSLNAQLAILSAELPDALRGLEKAAQQKKEFKPLYDLLRQPE